MNYQEFITKVLKPTEDGIYLINSLGKKEQDYWNLSSLWKCYHELGWYHYLFEKDINKAKQCFFLCGNFEILSNKMYCHVNNDGNISPYNMKIDRLWHLGEVLLTDNQSLIKRRLTLTYPEREDYIYKTVYIQVIINELIKSFLEGPPEKCDVLFPLMEKSYKAKQFNFEWDIMFFEGLAENNEDKMQKAIEIIASTKVHQKRQKFDYKTMYGDWENGIMSYYGILYTKLAWILGFELEIKSPLVSIAKDLFPVEPLEKYDITYDFLEGLF